ncbi:MMPL family transporter [Actinacidiphila guanduensis]|uniref:Putative drug exporter of the RND superfamily n=1 Tax=Actinacidiphila guanduensis TaxID=310781 RepID=A0A1H0JC47_9ACTN|nr:MMPL family transporter [Actinacidiphila guanduensis]SDO41328.1 putative drug exporter of the RND superfamily [Actinacidiphila guanduensis]
MGAWTVAGVARWCFRHKWWVIAAWLVALLAVGGAGRSAGDAYSNAFSLKGTESAKVLDLLDKAVPEQSGEADTVVWHVDSGSVRDQAVKARITPMLAKVAAQKDVGDVVSPYTPAGAAQVSKDGRTAYARVTYTKLGNDLSNDQAQLLIDTAHSAAGDGLHVEVGGNKPAQAEQPVPELAEGIGIAAAAVVLFLALGSLFGMLLPIVTALFGIGISSSAIILLSHGMDVADFSPQLATLVGLGVGIDYALFIVTRHRKAILRGRSPEEAAVTALNTSGRAVLFAGGTVCIALLGMFTLRLTFLDGVAVAAALTVVITVAAAVTLLPALLGVLGMRVLSRRQRRRLAAEGPSTEVATGPAARWSAFVQRRPRWLALVAVAVMATLAIPALSLRLGSSDQGNNPTTTTTRKAYDMLADGFGPGFNGPLTILAEVHGPRDTAALNGLVTRLRSTPGIAYAAAAPVKPGTGVALVQAVPTTSPQDKATSDLIDHLRDDVVPAAERGSTMRAYVGGQTAIFKDFSTVLFGKLPLFIGVIIALGFVLLLFAFRSLVVPLTAAVMNLVAAAASFGVLVAVFQWGWGGAIAGRAGPVDAFLPVIMLSLLFGLSMDYQVFLVSRMHEEWVHTRDNARAVRVGLAETSRVINSAAVIMICVFAAFVLSGQRVLAMFGVGLAGAVALDAFILRTVLVPSLMHLFGPANWWLPRWLDRRLPHLAVEPAEEDDTEAAAGAFAGAVAVAGADARGAASGMGSLAAGGPGAGGAIGAARAGVGGSAGTEGAADGSADGHLVRGRVTGAAGLPVPHSELTLIASDGRQVARGQAGQDGTFALPAPRGGSYVLVANAPGHHPQTASVLTGTGPVDCDLRLTGTGTLAGTVRRADGRPVQDVRVVLQDADGHEVATLSTGADGSYSFDNLYPGRYTLLTQGYPPFPATVRIPDGGEDGDGDIDLELTLSSD